MLVQMEFLFFSFAYRQAKSVFKKPTIKRKLKSLFCPKNGQLFVSLVLANIALVQEKRGKGKDNGLNT